jgi:hypothetical protein
VFLKGRSVGRGPEESYKCVQLFNMQVVMVTNLFYGSPKNVSLSKKKKIGKTGQDIF